MPGACCKLTTVPKPRSSFESLRTCLAGISAIPVTPFDGAGDIDHLAAERVVRRIVDCGIEVVVACGNTSEQASLAEAEAAQLTGLTVESSGGATVLAGVGGDLRSAISQAVRAVELGAAGIMIHYPTDPYVTEEGLIEYYASLAEATDGAVVLYLRGPGLSFRVLDRLAERPNVIAVKYAIPDALAFADICSRYSQAFVPICGLAELWAPFFWLAGAKGFTSGLANVAPTLSLAMLEALRRGDYTRVMELWRVLEPFERLRARHRNGNNVPVVKEALELLGIINGSVRPPLAPLGQEDRSELTRIVSDIEGWA
jgi:4-hydroxy-tetrahydrodipicolinate synthase